MNAMARKSVEYPCMPVYVKFRGKFAKVAYHDEGIGCALHQSCEAIPAGYKAQDLAALLLEHRLTGCLLLLHVVKGLLLQGTLVAGLCSLSGTSLCQLLILQSHGHHSKLLLLLKVPLLCQLGQAAPQALILFDKEPNGELVLDLLL